MIRVTPETDKKIKMYMLAHDITDKRDAITKFLEDAELVVENAE